MLATLEWIRPCLQHRDAESCALMLRSQGSDDAALTVGGLLVLSLVLGGVAVGLNHMTFDQWAGVLTLTFLVTVTIPALSWLARKEGDPGLARLLLAEPRSESAAFHRSPRNGFGQAGSAARQSRP